MGEISMEEWGAMTKTVEVTAKTVEKMGDKIDKGQEKTDTSLSGIHKKMDSFFLNAQCGVHATKIKTLEERPGADKWVKWGVVIIVGIVSILGAIGLYKG